MDLELSTAARALATGDYLGALKRVALRDDPHALALRGIVMAQLGDLPRAKELLKHAANRFAPHDAVARARCVVAEAEIALVSRDLSWPPEALAGARALLQRLGDHTNAVHARNIEARRLLLVGRLAEAESMLAHLPDVRLPPAIRAAHHMVEAGIAIRRVWTGPARTALDRARAAAEEARIPALSAEVETAQRALTTVAARLISSGQASDLLLQGVEQVYASDALVVDAFRNVARRGAVSVPLATRPVLAALLRALAEAWPADVPRATLLADAFGARYEDESHRARLRVEIGRLRRAIFPLATIKATRQGFVLLPHVDARVAVLAPPDEGEHGSLLALLSDGETWSSAALAIALDVGRRKVQRALEKLAVDGKVQPFGRGPRQRWIKTSIPGFPTILLLPGPPPHNLESRP